MVRELSELIDAPTAIATLRAAVGQASVTGGEAGFANFLLALMPEIGIHSPQAAEFFLYRRNVWGVKPCSGRGRRLLLMGHTDVVQVSGWRERWPATRARIHSARRS